MTETSCSTIATLRGPVALSHLFLHSFVRDGDFAVDATCGNGHDTLLLARLVGTRGRVWGFDIQELAFIATNRRLAETEMMERVTLLPFGHEKLTEYVTGPVQVVLFNLGYLPGGNRSIVTRPDTTGTALVQSLQLLAPGGIVLITVYPGHEGGAVETSVVERWAAGLDPRSFHSWRMGQTNVTTTAPYLLLVQKAL
jgi:predicted methyltransferase